MERRNLIEWFDFVFDDQIRKQLKINCYSDRRKTLVSSLPRAIEKAFSWFDSEEGTEYWQNIHTLALQDNLKLRTPISKKRTVEIVDGIERIKLSPIEPIVKEEEVVVVEDNHDRLSMENLETYDNEENEEDIEEFMLQISGEPVPVEINTNN